MYICNVVLKQHNFDLLFLHEVYVEVQQIVIRKLIVYLLICGGHFRFYLPPIIRFVSRLSCLYTLEDGIPM